VLVFERRGFKVHRIILISDFNTENLAAVLSRSGTIQAESIPFGQVMQCLLGAQQGALPSSADIAVVWTTPEGASPAYRRRLLGEGASLEESAADARMLGDAITRLPSQFRQILVPTWSATHPLFARRGLLDFDSEYGPAAALLQMNATLAESVRADRRIYLFDSSRWHGLCGSNAYDPRLWYASKTPFSLELFKLAAGDFSAAIRGLEGGAKKLLLLDLDGTLWGGVVGDDGWEALRVGGHDPVGEAYRDFQAALRALTRRGVLLGIVSKNDEAVALNALRSHPEMVLRPEDFAGWRINWQDKARNIVELLQDLNLGLDAVVFIDDNPVERDRVSAALPEVLVPQWPSNPAYYCRALAALDCFDAPTVSAEDRARTAMYVADRERKRLRQDALGLEDWLQSLQLTLEVERLGPTNLPRAAQLLNKTNQLNLSTRRLSAAEFQAWAEQANHLALVFKVSDKFGDYGLVGIGTLALEPELKSAHIVDFVLSCRVMGRKVEEAIVAVLAAGAHAMGANRLFANYLPTAKNAPCLEILEQLAGDAIRDGYLFSWSLEHEPRWPDCVKLVWKDEGTAALHGKLPAVPA